MRDEASSLAKKEARFAARQLADHTRDWMRAQQLTGNDHDRAGIRLQAAGQLFIETVIDTFLGTEPSPTVEQILSLGLSKKAWVATIKDVLSQRFPPKAEQGDDLRA